MTLCIFTHFHRVKESDFLYLVNYCDQKTELVELKTSWVTTVKWKSNVFLLFYDQSVLIVLKKRLFLFEKYSFVGISFELLLEKKRAVVFCFDWRVPLIMIVLLLYNYETVYFIWNSSFFFFFSCSLSKFIIYWFRNNAKGGV